MLSTIYMTCISCKSCDLYKNRIVRPNIENAASARASDSFWSKYLLHKKRVLLVYLKSAGSHFMLFVKYSQHFLKSADVH